MKSIVYIFLLGLLILLTGCAGKKEDINKNSFTNSTIENQTTTKESEIIEEYKSDGEIPDLLKAVVKSEKEFMFVDINRRTMEKTSERKELLSQYAASKEKEWGREGALGQYRVVDLDGDNYCEVVIDVFEGEVIILHYENEKVYGFEYPWRGMKVISYKGVIEGSSSADTTYYSIMRFEEGTYRIVQVAAYIKDKYYIGDKEVSKQEYDEYKEEELFKGIIPYLSDLKYITE